jgi:hypothetical protein
MESNDIFTMQVRIIFYLSCLIIGLVIGYIRRKEE